jgi:hypothetical protein
VHPAKLTLIMALAAFSAWLTFTASGFWLMVSNVLICVVFLAMWPPK